LRIENGSASRFINSVVKSNDWPALGVGGLHETPFTLMNSFRHDKASRVRVGKWSKKSKELRKC
jgi:hypothetical protein